MTITVVLPAYLHAFAGGRGVVELSCSAATVGDALRVLGDAYPGVYDRVLTEQGEVRQHVNVFCGGESIRYTGGLGTAIADGAELFIVPAVSGG